MTTRKDVYGAGPCCYLIRPMRKRTLDVYIAGNTWLEPPVVTAWKDTHFSLTCEGKTV